MDNIDKGGRGGNRDEIDIFLTKTSGSWAIRREETAL